MSRLEFLRRLPSDGRGSLALYRCSCGAEVAKLVRKVAAGRSASCGCLRVDSNRRVFTTHGGSKTPLYRVWFEMLQRCHNSAHKDFKLYGGRGVTVCPRWRESFQAFVDDMGPRPTGLTVERGNNDLGYSRENCSWQSLAAQANNRRNTVRLTVDGRTLTLREWEAKTGVPYTTLRSRHQRGWSPGRIVTTPQKEAA